MIKALLIDLDDTLYDNYTTIFPRACYLSAEALVNNGLNMDKDELHKKIMRLYPSYDISITKVMKKIFDEAGISDEKEIEKLLKISQDAYNSVSATDIFLPDGIKDMLERLKQKYILTLVTIGKEKLQNEKIDTLRIRELFEYISIVSSGTKIPVIKSVINKYNLTPSEAVFIGDKPTSDIESAKIVGLYTIRIKKWKFECCEPKNDMQRADYTITDPLEIEKTIEYFNE